MGSTGYVFVYARAWCLAMRILPRLDSRIFWWANLLVKAWAAISN